jgi:hypothetical protein
MRNPEKQTAENTTAHRMSNGRGKLIFFAQKTTGSLDFSGKRCKL